MLHYISDHYPIYLTVSKTRSKRDVKQSFFRDSRRVDFIAFDRDLQETLDSYRCNTQNGMLMKYLILL